MWGIDVFVQRDIPFLKQYNTKIIVNVCGKTVEDYLEVVEKLGEFGIPVLTDGSQSFSAHSPKAGAPAPVRLR